MTLADAVQLEGQNHYSGSILVSYQEHESQIFFQKGEVVHSEVGSYTGEEAFRRILAWPGGHFQMHANVSSLHRPIEKRLDHLIPSAHQWLDEMRHSGELEQGLGRAAP